MMAPIDPTQFQRKILTTASKIFLDKNIQIDDPIYLPKKIEKETVELDEKLAKKISENRSRIYEL